MPIKVLEAVKAAVQNKKVQVGVAAAATGVATAAATFVLGAKFGVGSTTESVKD